MPDLFSYGPGSIKEFIKTNHRAILYTIILHLVVAIILVFAKVDSLKKDRELGVTLDFSKESKLEELLKEEQIEVSPEWLERVYEARQAASNQAVNLNDEINQEISTQNYVQDLLNELESQKDDAFREKRERLEDIIASNVFEDDAAKTENNDEEEETQYTGPTTITYEFLEEPKARKKVHLSIPVYRCEGGAKVVVEIAVRNDGSVSDAKVISTESANSPECFMKAAVEAANSSLFHADFSAANRQKARITYQFVAQ